MTATSDQVLALIDSVMEGDADRFRAVSLQIAAKAALQNRHSLQERIIAKLDKPRPRRRPADQGSGFVVAESLFHREAEIPRELHSALEMTRPDRGLSAMTLAPGVHVALEGVAREWEKADDLRAAGLGPANRVLFTGPPGTGKTTAASALAAEIGWPMIAFKMHGIVKQHLGETSAMLATAMEHCRKQRAVILVDEIDSIGTARGNDGQSAGREMDRTVNALLVMLDTFAGAEGLLIAATNFPKSLDSALWRRFDVIADFPLPDADLLAQAMRATAAGFRGLDAGWVDWSRLARAASEDGHSFATATMACRSAAKRTVLDGSARMTTDGIEAALRALRPMRKEPA